MRAIEFLRDRFVPDLAECGAAVRIQEDLVRCTEPAVMMVRIDGVEDYVCAIHLTLLMNEKGDE